MAFNPLDRPTDIMPEVAYKRINDELAELFGLVGNPSATYLGFTATRGKMPGAQFTTYKQMQSRIDHRARASMRGTVARYVNAYGVNGTATGAAMPIAVSIEYPLGTFNRVTFGGAASSTIPDGGVVDADAWVFDVPRGALFREWTWISNAAGVPYVSTCQNVDGSNGGTTTADLTASGGTVGGSSLVYGAVAFMGQTTDPSILIMGTSRDASLAQVGYGTNDIGVFSRGVSGAGGVCNIAISGLSLWQYTLTTYVPLLDLAQYATHVCVGEPINDVIGGDTVSTLTTNVQNLISMWGKSAISVLPAGASKALYVALLTRSGTTATAKVLSTAGLTTGQNATFRGASLAAYNITAPITVVDGNTITFPVAGSPATPAVGAAFKPVFLRTCEPYATSTDSYATTANQTKFLDATREGIRTAWNDKVRSGTLVGMTDFFDTADQVESARNSGLWRAGTVPLVGADGLHAVQAGEMAIAAAVNGARFGTFASLPGLG